MYCFNKSKQPIVCFNDTREICTELEQLAVSHVTWIGQSSMGHHQELDWKQEKQMHSMPASLWWTYPLLMASSVVWICDMIILASLFDSPKCFNFMLPKLFAVTYNSRRCCSGLVHISLVLMNESNNWLLSVKVSSKQYIGLIICPNLVHFHTQKFIWWSVQIL